jgi:hypothetical protein
MSLGAGVAEYNDRMRRNGAGSRRLRDGDLAVDTSEGTPISGWLTSRRRTISTRFNEWPKETPAISIGGQLHALDDLAILYRGRVQSSAHEVDLVGARKRGAVAPRPASPPRLRPGWPTASSADARRSQGPPVTPRAGGEADKFGGRYEGAWTVRMLLEIIAARATSIQVERPGEEGWGAEFLLRREAVTEAHQVKRQPGNLSSWTINRLNAEGVLAAAAAHIASGEEFHFVSTVPARLMDELSDRARRSDDFRAFVNTDLKGNELSNAFQQLLGVWGEPEQAWRLLRGLFVHWPDERELRASNAALAGALLTGASGEAMASSLGDLTEHRLGLTLGLDDIVAGLGAYEIALKGEDGISAATTEVVSATERWLASVEPELLQPVLLRRESADISAAFDSGARVVFAIGDAGRGKTGVMHEIATGFQAKGAPVLALRLDRAAPSQSATQLGRELSLTDSPVTVLAAAAGERECLLVIDQLDAVSYASARIATESFDAVAEMLRQAEAFPQMRVVLAVRRFDVDNDPRLRGLVADPSRRTVDVGPLDGAQVDTALERLGVAPADLTRPQRELLRVPLNLVLLSVVVGDTHAMTFQTTRDLMDLFWDRRRREADAMAGRQVHFEAVIRCLSEAMSAQQRLAVPSSTLDQDGLQSDGDVLKSLHVVVADGRLVAFFHETFFDYAFARQWLTRGESLVGFLLSSAQELFRRAQVRQILLHLRDDDEARFRREVSDVLNDERIRFHIKDVVIAIVRALPHPSRSDWLTVEPLIEAGGVLSERLWQALRTDEWFVCLDEHGVVERWLASSDPALITKALETMAAGATTQPDRLRELLATKTDNPEFANWFRWLATWLPFAEHRPLFDLLVESVGRGEWAEYAQHLWMVASPVGEREPEWASELLAVWLTRPEALVAPEGRIVALDSTDHSMQELARRGSADGRTFVERLLGYVLGVMTITEYGVDKWRPIHDAHFTYRPWHGDHFRVEDTLLSAMARALADFARDDPEAATPHLEQLAGDPHDGAQWLLYQALRGAPERFAPWAAKLLSEGDHRLACGYTSDSYWATRELIEAVAPHWNDEELARVEQLLLTLAPEWETRPGGYSQFTLLSAIPEDRLSTVGRRRLCELQRRFDSETPKEPEDIVAGFVGPPVPTTAVPHMSDDDWLRVAVKYSADTEDFATLTGGAREQANVLAEETQKQPARFAGLGLRFDQSHNPAYLAAILRGLGQTGETVDPADIFALVRHAATIGDPEFDRWLGWSLRPALTSHIPKDVIDIVVDRALHAPSPEEDLWLVDAGTMGPYYGGDPFHAGMNSDRGSAALTLGDLLVHDTDGRRTAVVAPSLEQLAGDAIVAVRACVGNVVNAAFRYAPEEAFAAFDVLVDTDERLLATDPVERLVAFVGLRDTERATPVVDRMLHSSWEKVREAGGRVAAFLALEAGAWSLQALQDSSDARVRTGAALVCAQRLPFSADTEVVETALAALFNDESPEVRDAAARVAPALRGRPLERHRDLLKQLIASHAFSAALPQLLITLETADSAIADVAIELVRRFILDSGSDSADIRTRAAGDARQVAELAVRIYVEDPDRRHEALDLVDRLLAAGAWGVEDIVGGAER